MSYNYARDWQMVVHDSRLNNGLTTPPTPLRPPAAQQTWTVTTEFTVDHICGNIAACANGPRGKFDAVHILAHGNRRYVQIGKDNISFDRLTPFAKLLNKTRWIVFWSCLVGSDDETGHFPHGHPEYFGARLSKMTNANVVVARQTQTFSWPGLTIDFRDWEGPVDIFHPNDSADCWQEPNPFRTPPKLDLERLIFP